MKKTLAIIMIVLSVLFIFCSCGEKEVTEEDMRRMKETVDESVDQLNDNLKELDEIKEQRRKMLGY